MNEDDVVQTDTSQDVVSTEPQRDFLSSESAELIFRPSPPSKTTLVEDGEEIFLSCPEDVIHITEGASGGGGGVDTEHPVFFQPTEPLEAEITARGGIALWVQTEQGPGANKAKLKLVEVV